MPTSEARVILEFPSVGKYRARILAHGDSEPARVALDVREYVEGESFTGFTRRGIRLARRAEIDLLWEILGQIRQDGYHGIPSEAESAPPEAPQPEPARRAGRRRRSSEAPAP